MIAAPRSPVPDLPRQARRAEQHCRSGGSLRPALAPGACLLLVLVLPMALLLQAVGDLLRHVGLVVLGQHAIGTKSAGRIEGAFGNDPLSLAEQVGQQALV